MLKVTKIQSATGKGSPMTAETVEQFLARKGQITKVEEGVRTHSTGAMYFMDKGEHVAATDKRFGGTLSDNQLLSVVEAERCI